MNPFKLFELSYLLDETPGFSFAYFWPLLVFFLTVFLLSFTVNKRLHRGKNPKLRMYFFGGIPSRMREFAMLGIFLSFLRDQNIPWLAMRLWLVLLFLSTIVYAVILWKHYEKGFEDKVKTKELTKEADKYLPSSSKRKKRKKRRR
jgi:hypothetical protein